MSKKGGKKKKKDAGGSSEPVSHPLKDVLSKEMKIMHLTEKIKIFAKETEGAHKQYKALEEEYKDYKAHQEDITVFLNEKLDDQYNKIDELEHTIVNLKLEKRHFGSDLETKYTEETTALRDELTGAQGKIQSLESELASLSSFQKRKNELEENTARLEKELALVKKETQQQLLELDRQHIRQKERMASLIKERVAETEKVTWAKWQSMYDDNTKKAMQKNKDMTIELKYQSRAAEKLMASNQDLQAKYKDAQREIRVYKNLQGEFGKNLQNYKQQIKQLQEKVQRYEDNSYIDVAQPQDEDESKKSEQDVNTKKASRGGGRAAVLNLTMSGSKKAGSSSNTSRNTGGSESEALKAAKKTIASRDAEIEQLKQQLSKYRAKANRHAEESHQARRELAMHHANVDQLGAFLLTALEDLRKRKQKLAQVPQTKRLPRNNDTGEILIPDIPYIQLPLQSREELVGEFIAHVRSLKLQVAANIGGNRHSGKSSPSQVGKLPSIHGTNRHQPIDISARVGNSVATQCSLDSGIMLGESLWTSVAASSSRPDSSSIYSDTIASRENLDSRAFITSAQPEHSPRMAGQHTTISRGMSNRPYTLH